MKKLLATDFWLEFNYDDPNIRYQKFLSRGRNSFKRLIESLLLYDNIVIPTQDYLSLTTLVGVLGENIIIELLKSESISFLRAKGALAYVGNGGGVKSYMIGEPDKKPIAFCAPVDEAVYWALNGLEIKPKSKKLPKLVLDATTEFEISKIADSVKHETYQDILNSSELRKYFSIRNTNLDELAGIGPNQVRIFGGRDSKWQGDEIDVVMALTSVNLELRMMDISNSNDSIAENPMRILLNAKVARTLERSSEKSFTELKEIAGLPDIGEAVLQKQLSIQKILEIASTKNGMKFREWFHENCRKDTTTTARKYADLFKKVSVVQKLPARVIRFIVTNLTGFINPGVGVGAGVIDSFFIEKLLRGSSPKFFLEELERTSLKIK